MDEQQYHGEELFSGKVAAGSQTYFIDVQRAANGAKYLKLTESRTLTQSCRQSPASAAAGRRI
jgi:hypothetical protein